jgi:hypothetical protein
MTVRLSSNPLPLLALIRGRCAVARRPGPRLLLVRVRLVVSLAGDGFEPGGGVAAVVAVFEHGEMADKRIGGRAVPVLLVRWTDDSIAGTDALDGAVAGTDQADAFGDVQGLADGAAVPVGMRPGVNPTRLTVMRDRCSPRQMRVT